MKTEIETEFTLGQEVFFIRKVCLESANGRIVHYLGVGVVAGVMGSLLDREILGKDFEGDESYVLKAAGKILRLPKQAIRSNATQAIAEAMACNDWMFEPETKPQPEVKP